VQLYQNQEKVAEHIAAEGGKDAVGKVSLDPAQHTCFVRLQRPHAAQTMPSHVIFKANTGCLPTKILTFCFADQGYD